MAKTWAGSIAEKSRKTVKRSKGVRVQCHCGKVLVPNRDGIVRCFDCKMLVNVNVFRD